VYNVSMATNILVYLIYVLLNAFLFKTAVSWGWDHDTGWGAALILSFISSMFVILHRYRSTNKE